MGKAYSTKEAVVNEAQKILNKSLRDIISAPMILDIEKSINTYGTRRKGILGELVEKYVFGLDVNTRSEADFKIAGIELKTNPLKRHIKKRYVSKERLVFSMINYDKIVNEKWETSSFLEKNKVLLLMFYLWLKDETILDHKFKFIHLLDLINDISAEDIFQIQKDWEYIVEKIKRGEAHLLSEGDTYYLGACTKAANNTVVRDQPLSRIPAKPRAFSFKQQYLNFIIQKQLLGKDVSTDSIFGKNRRLKTIEEIVHEKFAPFIGIKDNEIKRKINWDITGNPKNWKRILANRILGVKSNRIEELDKADVTLKVITLESSGVLKESISFPAFDYKDLITQTWYDAEAEKMSEFYAQLEIKKFLFVVFQKIKSSNEIVLKKIKFWNFPMSDLYEAERVWKKTVDCIRTGRYEDLPKISESDIVHVRPHGRDSNDTAETPQGKQEMKKCFWLNAKYIQKAIE